MHPSVGLLVYRSVAKSFFVVHISGVFLKMSHLHQRTYFEHPIRPRCARDGHFFRCQVVGIIAIALLEAPSSYIPSDYSKTYLAVLIITVILALLVLIVTCGEVEAVTGKTFLVKLSKKSS